MPKITPLTTFDLADYIKKRLIRLYSAADTLGTITENLGSSGLGIIRNKDQAFIGVVWVNNRTRKTSATNWVFEYYGTPNDYDEIYKLAERIEKDLNVSIVLTREDIKPREPWTVYD